MAEDSFVEDSFVEDTPKGDSFVEEPPQSKADMLKDLLARYQAAANNEPKSSNAMQYASGMAKPAALLEALFGGHLSDEYSEQKATLSKNPAQSLPESITRSVTDPIEAALKTVPSLYEKNVQNKIRDYESLDPADKGLLTVAGALASPINKAGEVGAIASKVPIVGKIASKALEGGAQGLAYNLAMSDPDQDSNLLTAIGAGAAINMAPAVLGTAVKAAGPVMQMPRQALEYIAGKIGDSKYTQAMIPKEKLMSTGSKLTEELRNNMSSFAGKLEGTGLNPDMPLGEVWKDPQLKEQFLNSVQKTMSARKRDAYSIPIKDIEDSISQRISSDETALMGSIDDFLSAKLLMTPKQRAEYFKLNSSWPEAKITDPRFSQAQDAIKGLLEDVEGGKLNYNLEDVANAGNGSRTAEIGGMRFNLTPEMKNVGGANVTNEAMNRVAARQALSNILRGREAISKIPVLGKAAIGTSDLLGDIGRGLEKISKPESPEAVARSVVNDPQKLIELARQKNSISGIAKSVLDNLKQGDSSAAMAKSFLLATNPEFRRMFVGQSAEQSQSR